jgi:hypothetical protein
VVGNHARTTKERRYSTRAITNHEWELYHLIKRHYIGPDLERPIEPRIKFDISRGTDVVFDVYEFRIRGEHGDDIGYRDGIGGISVPLNKRIFRSLRRDPCDFDVHGHYHTWNPGKSSMGNGSLIGPSAFSHGKRLEEEDPQQGFFLVDQGRRKVTAMCPVWVT